MQYVKLYLSMDMSLSELQEIVKDREAWCAAVHGVTKSQTRLNPSLLQGIFPTRVSHTAGRFCTSWATREAKNTGVGSLSLLQ